jgi:hypothetical protein
MLIQYPDVDEPYVPFTSSRHPAVRLHEVRRREPSPGRSRRAIGRALVRAGLALARPR